MIAIETRAGVSAGSVASGAPDDSAAATASPDAPAPATPSAMPGREIGGRDGPEPTRYGDWEKNGRCIDF